MYLIWYSCTCLYGHVQYHPVPSCTCLGNLVLTCTILYSLVPIREILCSLVLSCTKPKISCTCWYRLVQSWTNRVHLVLACTVWYQTKKSGTALYHLVLACTYWGNLVLAGSGTYLYILVRTNLPLFVQVYRIPDGRSAHTTPWYRR